jgi:hypothetical protein
VIAAVLMAVACGCGGNGSSTFDEARVRERILARSPGATAAEIDATIDVVRNACESGDRHAMAQLQAEDPEGYDLARLACPRKVAAAERSG